MECKKCKCLGIIVLRGKDCYCESCFLTNTNHKFRACIGKKKILSKNEKVLVCLSGGAGSSVLLDLIYNGLALDSHKKLRITPYFLHVMDLNEEANQVSSIVQQCARYNVGIHVIHISEYMVQDSVLPEVNSMPTARNENANKLLNFLSSMPSTVQNDQLLKIKRSLFLRVAKQLQCNFIFTAETTTTLAMNLLTNLSLGRGSQVENDVGFCDLRNDDVKLLRPMKDISAEEIEHYIRLKELTPIPANNAKDNSLQSVIKTFVTNLQESFSATISTVCKTADKLGVQESCGREEKCVLCESDLCAPNTRLTALEATNFSRMVSDGQLTQQFQEQSRLDEDFHVNKSLFPFYKDKVCYGCSRNLSESDSSLLPSYIRQMLRDE